MQTLIYVSYLQGSSVQFSSVAQSCPTLCDPMNRRAPSTCHIRPSINVCLKSQVSHFQLLLLFCRSVTSNSLQPLGPALCQASLSFTISQSLLNLCPLSQSCPLSSPSPASGSFLRSQLFISSGQSIGASTSTSVLLMNIQG